VQMMQKPYCEHDACFVIINAPIIFRMMWSVMSLVMTAKQKSKVRILGNTSDKVALDKLLQLVPPSMLPQDIGGERQGLQNIYPPTPADEIPGWISRMSSIQMWPPAPLPAAVPNAGAAEAGCEAQAVVAPPSPPAADEAEVSGRPTTGSTGRAITESTGRAGTDCSTLAVAGGRADTECSTLAVAGDVAGTKSPKQQQQCCAIF